MEIKIKYFDPELTRLQKFKIGDWIDLRAADTVCMNEGAFYMIPLGVAMKLPEGYEAHIAPRSSTFKNFGIIQVNGVGIVDESYCGEDDQWRLPALAMRQTVIHKNDRICQFRIVKKQPEFDFVEVEHMEDANRGGFGSTGTR